MENSALLHEEILSHELGMIVGLVIQLVQGMKQLNVWRKFQGSGSIDLGGCHEVG